MSRWSPSARAKLRASIARKCRRGAARRVEVPIMWIRAAIRQAGSIAGAAEIIGVGHNTLVRRMRERGL